MEIHFINKNISEQENTNENNQGRGRQQGAGELHEEGDERSKRKSRQDFKIGITRHNSMY